MNYLIYTEGYSEENCVKKLWHRIGRNYSNDAATILADSSIDYINNCESDSRVLASIQNDHHLISKSNKSIIIVCDIIKKQCFSHFKREVNEFLDNLKILNPVYIINSRPGIETSYLEQPEILKKVILSYCRQEGYSFSDFSSIDVNNLFDSRDWNSVKKILKTPHGISICKKAFSERFFGTLYSTNNDIEITKRLKSKLA